MSDRLDDDQNDRGPMNRFGPGPKPRHMRPPMRGPGGHFGPPPGMRMRGPHPPGHRPMPPRGPPSMRGPSGRPLPPHAMRHPHHTMRPQRGPPGFDGYQGGPPGGHSDGPPGMRGPPPPHMMGRLPPRGMPPMHMGGGPPPQWNDDDADLYEEEDDNMRMMDRPPRRMTDLDLDESESITNEGDDMPPRDLDEDIDNYRSPEAADNGDTTPHDNPTIPPQSISGSDELHQPPPFNRAPGGPLRPTGPPPPFHPRGSGGPPFGGGPFPPRMPPGHHMPPHPRMPPNAGGGPPPNFAIPPPDFSGPPPAFMTPHGSGNTGPIPPPGIMPPGGSPGLSAHMPPGMPPHMPPHGHMMGAPPPGIPPGSANAGGGPPVFNPPGGGGPVPVPNSAPPSASEEIWVENMTGEGKAYYYHLQTRETRWDKPENAKILTQSEVDKMGSQVISANSTPSQAEQSGNSAPTGAPVFTGLPVPQKPPEVAEWCEYKNPEGRPYYHNSKTNDTTWEKPKILLEWDNFVSNIQKEHLNQHKVQSIDQPPPGVNPVISAAPTTIMSSSPAMNDPLKSATAPAANNNTTASINGAAQSKQEDSSSEEEEENEDEEEEDEEEEEEKVEDKSRPVLSTPVSGTPWCVVWTGDSRVFFFNASQRLSVWDTPDDLKNRADVEELLKKPPSEPNENKSKKHSDSKSKDEPPVKKAKMSDAAELQEANLSDEDVTMNEGDEATNDSASQEPQDSLMNRGKIHSGLEAAKEAEEKAARERAVLPIEVRTAQFRELLIEKQVSAFSTWEKELHKIVFDPRYLLLTCKERKQNFEAFVKERAEEEKREKKNKLREVKEQFRELLKEANITARSSFSDFGAKFSKDERYRKVEKMRERESLFQDFQSDIRKKEKESKHKEKEKVKADFISLLKEQKNLSRSSHWSEIKKKIDSEARYKAVESSSRREDWFRDYCRKLEDSSTEDNESKRERDRKEREEASIKERKKVVNEALASSLKDRDKERESHRHSEAVQTFKALLVDMVKDSGASWKEVKKQLRKDSRWAMISKDEETGVAGLERSEREALFKEHIAQLTKKNRDIFHKLLDETQEIELASSWKSVKKLIRDDPRYEKFSSSDRKRESEFKNWLDERILRSKNDLRDLLKETKIITHKSQQLIDDGNEQHMKDVISLLEKDKRYLILDGIPEERMDIIMNHVKKTEENGPPPPPTATEPSRRK